MNITTKTKMTSSAILASKGPPTRRSGSRTSALSHDRRKHRDHPAAFTKDELARALAHILVDPVPIIAPMLQRSIVEAHDLRWSAMKARQIDPALGLHNGRIRKPNFIDLGEIRVQGRKLFDFG
jgi:hypothetical protein